jgi:hypothetical protein
MKKLILLAISCAVLHAQFVGVGSRKIMTPAPPPPPGGKVLISHAFAAGTGTATTSAINCAGANLAVMVISDYGILATADTPSSSPANTWVALGNSQNGAGNVAIWYAKNATVNGSMTFHTLGNYPMAMAMCWSNADTSAPFDQQAQSGAATGTTCQAGSITPGVDGEVIIAGFTTLQTSLGTVSLDSGFTKLDTNPFNSGTSIGGGDGYLIQPTAGAVNPQWTVSTETGYACTIASFK